MNLRIWLTPEADTHICELGAWWRAHRTAAPTRFRDELDKAYAVLTRTPEIGSPYAHQRIPNLRRYRLKKTPYHVYYVPRVDKGDLIILAVWSGSRRRGPPLRAL